ncbi:MAG TPA: tetratricopeptide repeat protein [Thermoanaerobaculia bacterium]|nr:tetratricopeptide repeat protein [Thermoanaerobaculia bacterium]
MQAFVFTDKRLERYAGQFVWLQVDIDNTKNAAFLTKYPIPAIPTLMVIDPKKESVALRYMSGATVPQLTKLLDDGRRAVNPDAGADTLLVAADQYAAEGLNDEAIKSYEQALAKAPKNWSRYGRAAESYVTALSMHGDNDRCTHFTLENYSKLRGTNSGANIAAMGLGCAAEINDKSAIDTLETATRESMNDPKIPLSGDDRSGMYQSLIAAREALKDEAGERKMTEEWSAFLDAEAAKAKTPDERTVYDSHRLGAYLALGQPEKAVPMLEQSEKDFPNDYNPPSRLSAAYKAMKKYDEALAASDRALAKVYGPRKISVLRNRADIYAAKGDKENARKTLQEAIDYANALPKGQRSENTIASLKKRLAAI